MNLIAKSLLSVFAVTWGAQASAAQFAWCDTTARGDKYLSGIVEIGEDKDAFFRFTKGPFAQSFQDHVTAVVKREWPNEVATVPECHAEETLEKANDKIRIQRLIDKRHDYIDTNWTGEAS